MSVAYQSGVILDGAAVIARPEGNPAGARKDNRSGNSAAGQGGRVVRG